MLKQQLLVPTYRINFIYSPQICTALYEDLIPLSSAVLPLHFFHTCKFRRHTFINTEKDMKLSHLYIYTYISNGRISCPLIMLYFPQSNDWILLLFFVIRNNVFLRLCLKLLKNEFSTNILACCIFLHLHENLLSLSPSPLFCIER